MGAEAGEAYVVLGIPVDLDEGGCMELLDGIVELASASGTAVVGGDVTRSAQLILAITVVGHAAAPEKLVTRGGAREGDLVVLTGEIGGAAAGRLLLDRPKLAEPLPAETAVRLRSRQLEPRPLLAAGRALAGAGATAMIDLSDGLGGDAPHLAAASGARLRIEAEALPLAEGVAEVASAAGVDPLRLAVSGGEDYELLATVPAERLEEATVAARAAGVSRLTQIGRVVAGEGVEIRLPDSRLLEPEGYDHLG
jgi:thiamine-monophosphate kinase